MDWLDQIGAFTDGMSPIQKLSLVLGAITTILGLIFGGVKARTAIIEYRTAQAAKAIQDRNSRSGISTDFTRDDIRSALRSYITPDCAQSDPSNSSDLRRVAAVRESIFTAVDEFITVSDNKHLLLLADTGMGKTTFCLNYFNHRIDLLKKGGELSCAIVPLGRPGALEKIRNVPSKSDCIILLDAFDEDTDAIEDSEGRLSEIMNAASEFAAVIVTCRSQFFQSDKAIPHRTGIRVVRPRRGGALGEHVFETLYLLPFKSAQIENYVKSIFPILTFSGSRNRKKARQIINSIPELSVRPMLLALLPDLIERDHKVRQLFDLYSFMIETWLERESAWIEPKYLVEVSKRLAVYIYNARRNASSERVTLSELHAIAKDANAPETVWNHLSARSLLNRDSDGLVKFSHRSIMEFFFVVAAIDGQKECFDLYWTDFMRDLFVSWGHSDDGARRVARAKEILNLDLEKLGLTPLSEPLPSTSSYSPKAYLQRPMVSKRRIAQSWRTYSTKLVKADGQRVLQDDEYGLVWVVPPEADYGDPSVRMMTHIQVMKQPMRDGLASRDQLLSLLEAEETLGLDLLPRNVLLWLGDTLGARGPVVVSIGEAAISLPGARSIGNFPEEDRHGHRVWAYAVATRPAGFGAKVPVVKAIPTMVSEIDWATSQRLHSMSEEEVRAYISTTFKWVPDGQDDGVGDQLARF